MRYQIRPSLFDRWLGDLEEGFVPSDEARTLRPALDLVEHPDRYEVVADLPGLRSEQVEVEFADGALRLHGERAPEAAPENGRLLRRERTAGRFERVVAFGGDVDVEGIEAAFRDGVLRVSVPKSERNRPRQIPVGVH